MTVLGSVASGIGDRRGRLDPHLRLAARPRHRRLHGQRTARIFCSKFEAELIAIDGLYKTADDLGRKFRGQPVQVNLDGDSIILKTLD